MKKLSTVLTLLFMVSFNLFAQSYAELWKQVDIARGKDLPKTQISVLKNIISKAQKEKSYGNLLAAELLTSSLQTKISPDSADSEKARLKKLCAKAETTDKVLYAVYNCALGRIFKYDEDKDELIAGYFNKAMANPALLAGVQCSKYTPLIKEGKDDAIFKNDLLHVIAFEAGQYDKASKYYTSVGNREAACYSAYMGVKEENNKEALDSLIALYGDLPICGNVAVAKYKYLKDEEEIDVKQRIEYIDNALKRWGTWENTNYLRNEREALTAPMFQMWVSENVGAPHKERILKDIKVRNINDLTLTITRTTLTGDDKLSARNRNDLAKIKTKLLPATAQTVKRTYSGNAPYEVIEDSLELPRLDAGVYLFELASSNNRLAPQYELYYVTNLYVIAEEQPASKIRYVVVNSTTGQPIPNVKIKLKKRSYYKQPPVIRYVETNERGEAYYNYGKDEPDEVYVSTNTDKACPNSFIRTNYYYGKERIEFEVYDLFTDRQVYRPGQTVHTSLLVHKKNNKELKSEAVANKTVKLTLRDANYEEVVSKEVVTDEFGTAAADFELPKGLLTGAFSIYANDGDGASISFNVEEYKRPTFTVEIDEYKEKYAIGDTVKLKGRAKAYSGMPVQGAEVSYTVNRNPVLWWWYSNENSETVFEGKAITDEKGEFNIELPFIFPDEKKSKKSANRGYWQSAKFYNFVVDADVTDLAGETRSASASLPLGTKTIVLTSNMPDKVLKDKLHQLKFSYLNAAGKPIEGKVRYAIAPYKKEKPLFGKYTTVETNKDIDLKPLRSGRYMLQAICENDTLEQEFVVFSMDDKRPVIETHDWFYISGNKFPSDGKPVYVQFGATDADQHVLYSIFSGNKVLDSGAIDQSNSLTTWKLTYKEEYGDGIVVNFAWVKNGKLYKHNESIARPMPDRHLNVKWTTFRNLLLPGQKEEWTLNISYPDGKPAKAQLMATLYDKSLDQIDEHSWYFEPTYSNNFPSYIDWSKMIYSSLSLSRLANYKSLDASLLSLAKFDTRFVDNFEYQQIFIRGYGSRAGTKAYAKMEMMEVVKSADAESRKSEEARSSVKFTAPVIKEDSAIRNEAEADYAVADSVSGVVKRGTNNVQMRENLNETAFFYPRLNTDANGNVSIKFTLPESLTTWRFMGLAHDKDINYGMLTDEVVAKKTVMVQPNMPRFVRMGDEAMLSTRIFNSSDKAVKGKATIEILDAETEKVLYSDSKDYALEANATTTATFSLASLLSEEGANKLSIADQSMLIVRIVASGDDYSDGEQQYLTVLPNREYVVNTYPFTQNKAGEKSIDLTKLFPANTTDQRLTVEYTNNPNWLMVQALPFVADANEHNAISLVSAYYANSLANKILKTSPKIRQTIESWRSEQGSETSMMSALEKNQDLKEFALKETPWVMEAKNESEQKQMLVRFFDDNQIKYNLSSTIEALSQLQNPDGSFSWWEKMPGSFYMTVEVVKTLTRLNVLMGEKDEETEDILNSAFAFLDREVAERVAEMKRLQRKGYKNIFPSDALCDYLYSNALAKRKTTADITYLIDLLAKKPVDLTIYGKANTAVILQQYKQVQKAKEYLQSIKEYTVYKEEMGRYFDTRKAYYSWFDYKIPTQVAAIESFKTIAPTDKQTIEDLQRWLLQSKRTQAWDTPVNSVNAIWAFMNNGQWTMDNGEASVLKLDGKVMELPKATAGLGYVKVTQPVAVNSRNESEGKQVANTFTVEKTSSGISWGAVYAQFFQPVTEIKASNAGLTVKRELFVRNSNNNAKDAVQAKVGDKVVVRITIVADRDYDFVQVSDKRPACLEPVSQISGYQYGGYYIAPKDYCTNYYFDMMAKGTHVVETEYFVDREGVYQSGTCTAQCAYAPEYTGRQGAIKVKVNSNNASN